jgi:hypothetical protein
MTVNNWNSRIEKQIYDTNNMGRWTGAAYNILDKGKLYIITGYRVCESKMTSDKSLSSYAQQYALLIEKGIQNPSPRTQFCLDLRDYIKSLELKENDYLILAMDANNGNEQGLGEVQELINECQLVDLYLEKHQDNTEFPTH